MKILRTAAAKAVPVAATLRKGSCPLDHSCVFSLTGVACCLYLVCTSFTNRHVRSYRTFWAKCQPLLWLSMIVR